MTKQVTLEQTPKGTQKVSQADTWETVVQAEGRAKASLALGCLVNSKNRDAGVADMGLLGVGGRS